MLDLVVDRGKRCVLRGISCAIPAGTVTGLLGPSGSGKTTLIRAIVGVQIVESGTVTVLGQPAGTAALRRTVGYVTQAPSVYADLSVRENARYFASLYGLGAAEADRAVATSPDPVEALAIRARIRRRAGDASGARADVDRGLALCPDDPRLRKNLGFYLARKAKS